MIRQLNQGRMICDILGCKSSIDFTTDLALNSWNVFRQIEKMPAAEGWRIELIHRDNRGPYWLCVCPECNRKKPKEGGAS